MVTRTNYATRPAVKSSSTNWSGPSGWARTAAAHASLPRTTAFAGSSTGNVAADRCDTVAGEYVVWSASVRCTAPWVGFAAVDWYAAGNVYLATSDGQLYNQAGSTTVRVVSGIALAPTDAVRCQPIVGGIDGAMEITALLIERFATLPEAETALALHTDVAYYFDGDGNGAGATTPDVYAWTGTDGSSLSTRTSSPIPILHAALSSPVATLGPGQVHLDDVVLSAVLASPKAAIGLLVQVDYDDTRSRIRVKAQGLDPTVIRVVVSSRVLGGSRWKEVRGGRVATADGTMVRTVDDYEFRAGEGMQYRIQGLSSSEGAPDVVVQQRVVTVADTLDETWLKFIAAPYRNRKVSLLRPFDGVARRSRVALYDVVGASQPVGVTDVHTGRTMTIGLATHSIAEREALDAALETGVPVFFQTPSSVPVPSVYAVIGDYSWRPAAQRSLRAIWTIQLTEVAAPPPSIVGSGLTYAVLGTQYGSYADLNDAVTTYAELGP